MISGNRACDSGEGWEIASSTQAATRTGCVDEARAESAVIGGRAPPRRCKCSHEAEHVECPSTLLTAYPRVSRAPECWIAPTAVLIGQVRLKRDASIWFGAVLRADDELIEIGERSNVQDNCVFHVDPALASRWATIAPSGITPWCMGARSDRTP